MHLEIVLINLEKFNPFNDKTINYLSQQEIQHYLSFTNLERKKQWLTVRYITYNYKKIHEKIKYFSNGKPFLNCCYISITHTKKIVAVAFAKIPLGIDAENINRNFIKISSKFLNQNETIYTNNFQMALIWTAKEAIYKLWSKPGLSFKNNILVRLPNKISTQGQFQGWILLQNKKIPVSLAYYRFWNHFLTIAQFYGHEDKSQQHTAIRSFD